jgi:hypothetical protein
MDGEVDIDVTVADLEHLLEVIRDQWVGDFPDRETKVRGGTLYISPDKRTLRLELRFPLDTKAFLGMDPESVGR